MKKLILPILYIMSVLLISGPPVLAADELWSKGTNEYKVQREGNSITLISTNSVPQAAGIPSLVGTINGTTFTGKQYLHADGCPNLEGYVPASGTVSADGNSISVTFTSNDFYSSSCTIKSSFEDSYTYTRVSTANTSPTRLPVVMPTSNDCWREFANATQTCLYAATDCNINCGNTSGSNLEKNKICLNNCSQTQTTCNDQATAAYKACVAAGRPDKQTKQTYLIEIKSFLDQIEKTEREIGQCPQPRVPSESKCVSEALSQFGLPTYLKDVAIEPEFTDAIVLDESRIQIISLPEGMKEAPDYLMNSISTNLTDFSKDFEIVVNNSEKPPILNLSPMYPTAVSLPDQSYAVVESSGLSAVITTSALKPGSSYSGNWQSLVTLDKDVNSNPAIINTPGLVLDSNAKVTLFDRTNQSVMEVSNGARIVVAGWAADDTLEAARDFVSQLSK